MSGPRITTGKDSRQDYSTPEDFIDVVRRRFGPPVLDLAASADNAKAPVWFGPGGVHEDALAVPWSPSPSPEKVPDGLRWLNPPFANIAPWARKCISAAECGAEILLLVPAAVGSNWFADYVAGHAMVYLLNGRLCFDGKNVYTKDCLLAHYRPSGACGICIWKWRTEAIVFIPQEPA